MIFLTFSPYFIISSFFTTLLLDRGVHVAGNREFPASSPWYPKASPSKAAKISKDETEALKKVLPLVTFDCRGKTGYFPDSKFNCEVFHYCQPDGGRSTFHCPAHQLFNQLSMVCERKTGHNYKLCREGSINPTKFQKIPDTKKLNSSVKISPILKPSLNSSSSKDKKIMTLEDLLTYMNTEQGGKETEPTFISRFHKAEEPQKSTKLSESANTKLKKEISPANDKKPSKSVDVELKAVGSDQSFKITKSVSVSADNSKKDVEEEEVSAEYDAIEGRKYRKHKRVGRVLDVETERQPKKETENKEKKPHSHMTQRSVSEPPQHQENTTLAPTSDTDTRNSSSPSLFAPDRSKARDIRKRKRYQGRKRKTTTPPDFVIETEPADLAASVTTVIPIAPTARQDLDPARNHAYKRRKSQRTRTRGDVHKIHKTEKIEPYTLPPLPMPEDEKPETTTQSIQKEETKNPWYKSTTPPPDESIKFGEKISDLDLPHYQTDVKYAAEHPEADFIGTKSIPASEELLSDEYREKLTMQSTHSYAGDSRPRSKSKVKNLKKYNEDDSYKHYESPSMKQHALEPVNMFPPPRAEPREHHSTPPQQMMLDYDSHSHKSKSHSFPKATTEDPFTATHSYHDTFQIETQEPNNHEDERWKTSLDKVKTDEKKVEVGSTFFFESPLSLETTKKPKLQETSLTESTDLKSVHKEKEMPKHTLAQQHLSKIMNDFFAMSSPKIPGRVHLDSDKEEDMIVPEYRIPDEDIYTGSESVAEDVEEIPPELLEVVDLITGNAENEKKNLKPRTRHEIIKINGPITNSEIEKIFLDDKFDEEPNQQPSSDGSYKKIVVIPRPEDKEDSRDIEEVEEVTSLKLEQFLKQYAERKPLKSLKVISLKPEPQIKRQPTILRAKKVPVRIIYRDQLAEKLQPKSTNQKPNIKIVRTQITSPRVKISSEGKRQTYRPITHAYSSYSQPQIILHPSSLFPPHPPPLPKKQYPLNMGYPFTSNSRLHVQNLRQAHSRRKRSIVSRLRRQIRHNQYFLPFSSPVYPSFNPKFVPRFSPFKPLFNPAPLHTSGSHLSPYAFPGYPVPKPPQTRPHNFRPSHPRPPPVRHVSPTGHQTVIVEEVPVPIPVEVPNSNFLQPAPSGAPPSKLPTRYSDNEYRNPSPPAIQTPPLIQRPQNRFPPQPPNNYRPFGMPSNIRPPPPPVNPPYRSPIPLTGPLPPRITSEGQVFALGVTNKPILTAPDPRPARPPSGGPNSPQRNLPGPYNPFNIHANSYPNFPYFQGAFTTPISNEPVAGRLMYSGYKPPKSTTGTKPPTKNKDRKASESSSSRSRSKPTQGHFEAPPRPMRESHVSYTEEVLSNGRSRERPKFEGYSTEHKDLNLSRQNSNRNSSPNEVPRKRRPGRRRRPRPYTTTQGSSISNDISPTPPPPEQIPPPPAEYTSKPSHQEVLSSLPSSSEGTRVHETSSHFPPAGYYGKDQLVQFFDSSSKSSEKNDNPKPRHKSLGESRSNIQLDDSVSSMSIEDGNEPVFGTRLRSKPSTGSRNTQLKNKQPPRLQTQKSEIRTRPNIRQSDVIEEKTKEIKPTSEGNKPQTQVRDERPPPRRRRPPPPRDRNGPPPRDRSGPPPRDRNGPLPRDRSPPPRDRSRPPSMMRPQTEVRPQPEVHHFNYNENMGNFYSVPKGLQNFVAPSANPQQGFRGSTDMFGLPHPVIDQSIYSLRPEGAPAFDPNFFSVPAHVAQQQQSPLHKMNVRPVPESVRDFFTAPETGSEPSEENSELDKKESESRHTPSKSKGENDENSESPVRKLRKPKRKNRYNPHSTEVRDSSETNSIKPQGDSKEGSTVRYREKPTTTTTTTVQPRSTTTTNYQRPISTTSYQSQNDIKESQNTFKQRSPLLPKALPELSKSLMNGKIDYQKLNATISTSVSISGAIPQANNTSSEEKENKRVFSSQNGGGLAVVRKGPKRKRARQRVSSTTGVPYVNNETNADAKYEIAASVLDIIKATTETERQGSGHHDNFQSERSRISNVWVESPPNNKHQR